MSRLSLFAVVACLAVVGCTEPIAAPSETTVEPSASVLPADAITGSATGSAHFTFFPGVAPGLGLRRLTFAATRHGDGRTSGEWQIVVGGTILHGSIDCLTLLPDGESARISGIVEQVKFSPTFIAGTAFAMEVRDLGSGQSGDADELSQLLAFRNAPPSVGRLFCETGAAPAELDFMTIEKGNFTVRAD